MSFLRRPGVWFPLAIAVLTALGSEPLRDDRCVHLSERDRGSYGLRPVWQARFDALSAVCGAGLLTYSIEDDYTPAGRWVLTGLGLAGALLYLAAARQAAAPLWAASGTVLPRLRVIVAVFLGLQVACVVLAALVGRIAGGGGDVADAAQNAIAAFASLGWSHGRHGWGFAVVAFVGALGWPVWLAVGRRELRSRALVATICGYVVLLLICAGLVAALEQPRGRTRAQLTGATRLADQPAGTRFTRALTQVVTASGAGMQTEPLADRAVSEGTKVVLAGVVLIGGLGGSAGGGLKWPLFITLFTPLTALVGRGKGSAPGEAARKLFYCGSALGGAFLGLAVLIALGALLIEVHIGSPHQSPPSFADALVDASSSVAGAGLTTGVLASLTGANLSRGIRQGVDLYQYGMAWFMLALFIGRIVPVVVLGRLAGVRFAEGPAPRPTLI
ncbi:MAG: hypothetical protein KA383_08110 [Phycisphaerae bacterium]|nr:hypothetical protein [Phycisphaerae bacterium]